MLALQGGMERIMGGLSSKHDPRRIPAQAAYAYRSEHACIPFVSASIQLNGTQEGNPMCRFESQQSTYGGHTHSGDNLTQFISDAVRACFGPEFFDRGGALDIQHFESGWTCVCITLPHALSVEERTALVQKFDRAMTRRGAYECRVQGEEGQVRWWMLKHERRPLI